MYALGRTNRSILTSPALLALVGLLGSAAIGVGAAHKPSYAALAATALVVIVMAWRWPLFLAVAGLVSQVWAPEDIFGSPFGSYPQAQKFLLLAGGLVMILVRRPRSMAWLVIPAYVAAAVFSHLGGTPVTGLTLGQTLLSFLTLTLAWVLFSVNWTRKDLNLIYRVLIALPLCAVVFGALLWVGGQWPLFTHDAPPRLNGSLIAPFLGSAAVCGLVASILLGRLERWRWASWGIVANTTILILTFTRGAMIAGGLALVPTGIRAVRSSFRGSSPAKTIRIVVTAVVVVAAATYIYSVVQTRDHETIFVPGKGAVKDASSGRFAAWSFAYHQAKVNLPFGRGLGAAPVIGAQYQHFLAQHNEYLRMLLETGYVGGILILSTMIFVLCRAIRRCPAGVRPDLTLFAVGVAIYSFTDNTLTSPQFSAPMLLLFCWGSVSCTVQREPTVTRPESSLPVYQPRAPA